jgi:hypothetical protein
MSLVKTPPVVSIPVERATKSAPCGAAECEESELTESEGADIDEDNISESLLSGEDTSLNGGSVGDGLIGVDSLGGLLAVEVLLEELLDLGDASGTSNEAMQEARKGQR